MQANSLPSRLCSRAGLYRALVAVLLVCFSCAGAAVFAQSSDDEADPVKLFERGQDAHARGELERAVELYDEAIKLRPEFPEAEYQKATALISLARMPEAEKALRRVVELRAEWALPHALLGDLLVRQKRFTEALNALAQALKLEPHNPLALQALTSLRLQTKSPAQVLRQLLEQLRTATAEADAPASLWVARGTLERALEDKQAALASFKHALSIDARNVWAHVESALTLASAGELDKAIESAKEAQRLDPASVYASDALARFYLQVGKCAEAAQTLDELDAATKQPALTASLRSRIAVECAAGEKERPALEEALVKDQRNAGILSRLCVLYRKDDPAKAIDYCRRALEVEPRNADYGVAYAAAMVQARRFADAATVLRRVIADAPDNYAAHANLAVALYELKRFREALDEYRWILAAKPETIAAYFFIATAHDNLGEYTDALAAYETFLARADPQQFRLEIEKVNLRLPSLRNQIKLGQGKKKS